VTPSETFSSLLRSDAPACGAEASWRRPALALMPMQDVTTLNFMHVIALQSLADFPMIW